MTIPTRFIVVVIGCGLPLVGASVTAYGDAPSAADFVPIISNGSATIADPSNVQVDGSGNRVTASTGQDAANAAMQETRKDLKSGAGNAAAGFMKFPSGCGVLATGIGTWKITANAEFSRLSQRRAYVQAFINAKKEMAQFLSGLDNDAKELIAETVSRLVDANAPSATNIDRLDISEISQQVSRVLRGFVVYEVAETQENGLGTVYVSIVSSPGTCLRGKRLAGGHVAAASLEGGVEAMLTEIREGLVPPIGARVIEVPGTAETAFVGFGAAVVGESGDSAVQRELRVEAERLARMYATDSLCGVIRGDEAAWRGSVIEKHSRAHQEFVDAQEGDPLNSADEVGEQRLSEAIDNLVITRVSENVVSSARSGRIPAGVPIKTWFDEEGNWVYAVAIYFPSASKRAGELGRMMDEAVLVPGDNKTSDGRPDKRSKTGPSSRDQGEKPTVPSIKPLPSGKVGGQKL